MNIPLVSVIVPNYNHARYLDERIQSILGQTYPNFEVIILDDCSSDNSVDVINRYKDNPHITHFVINKENSGSPFKQWRKGFELAKGKWIWIAESDDYSEPEFIETLIRQVDTEDASFAFCRSNRMDQNGNAVIEHWQDGLKESFVMDGKQFIENQLKWKCIVWNASSVIFRREFALTIPDEYTNYKAAGDWLFWICLSWLGTVSFVNTPLNYFRLHNNNTTQQSSKSGLADEERVKLYKFILSKGFISKHSFEEIRLNDIYYSYVLGMNNRARTERKMEIWNVSKKERFIFWLKKMRKKIIAK